jgi:NAD(P)-dependent dehydrogenase (short-subunit alcohol dehydrogenase family)
MTFKDKVVLIVGGTSGIGLAAAKLMVDHGAKVIITGQSQESVDLALAELGVCEMGLIVDLANLADIDNCLGQVHTKYGPVNTLLLNAGMSLPMPIADVTEEIFDRQVDVNLKGIFFTLQKAMPIFAAGATVVVTTSIANQSCSPTFAVYGAAKAGVRSLVKSLSLHFIKDGIRINAVSPGPIDTPLFDKLGIPDSARDAVIQQIVDRSPSRRFGQAVEVARAMLFLASDDSSYMVGEELVIDGGIRNLP